MNLTSLAVTVGLTASVISGSAEADFVKLTYTGFVETSYGSIARDVFGDIDGKTPYEATFYYDTSIGFISGDGYTESSGGSLRGTQSPSLRSSVEINRKDFTFTGSDSADIYSLNYGTGSNQGVFAILGTIDISFGAYVYNNTSQRFIPASINQPYALSFASQPNDAYGRLKFRDGEVINFFVSTLKSEVVSVVPLPASAPMFGAALLSIAGLGYVVKRRQAAAA